MTIATALIAGNDPLPQLAEHAIEQALAHAGLKQAQGVLLFLTPEFARHAQAAVTAAARAASCTQVVGAIVAGVFTESNWVLDRPAAAALVLGEPFGLAAHGALPLLSYAGSHLPPGWLEGPPRFGGSFSGSVAYAEPAAWQSARTTTNQSFSASLLNARLSLVVSGGLTPIGEPLPVTDCSGYDLKTLDGKPALRSLRAHSDQPLHHLGALLVEGSPAQAPGTPSILSTLSMLSILSANPDESLTLSAPLHVGQRIAWAQRSPVSTEAEHRTQLDTLASEMPAPDCLLAFSCIGRGPYFYGGEDRDRIALIERFPKTPLLGCYGTSQLTLSASGNRALQNAVVVAGITAEPRSAHVQSIT